MTDIIMNILQWAIPSGGIGAAIAWIANRKVKDAENAKKIHDTYKSMYEDVSRLLEENRIKYEENTRALESLTNENDKTRRAFNRLSRAIEAIQTCPYRGSCPVNNELSLDAYNSVDEPATDGAKHKPRQQRKPRQPERGDKQREGDERPVGDVGENVVRAPRG